MKTIHIGPSPQIAVDHLGKGPLAVFLHGIGGNRRNWTEQLHVTSPEYHAAAWDMRGYGDSEDYDGPLQIDDICSDLARVLDHFEAPAAHVVGLSMGGMVAQEFYRRHPQRTTTLVLCNTNAGVASDFTEEQRSEFVRLRRQPLLDGKEPRDLLPAMRATLFGSTPPPGAVAAIEQSISSLHKDSYIKAVESIVSWDCSDMLHSIRVPTLLIGSREDRVTPLEPMQAMHERIPGSEFHIIEGSGHLSNLERPQAFNDLLLKFLRAHRGGAGDP